jgi:penicillin-binding protein 1C
LKNKLKAFLQRIINWIKKNKIKSLLAFLLVVIYYFSLPRTLFQEPYSTVIESKEGELLAAKIARDGQWRFPAQDSVPDKFKK